MPLKRVRIEAFRCLTEVELSLHPGRSFVFGPNGAGKTSILEAVHVLGRGRSFRTRQSSRLVQRGQPGFTVFGEVSRAETVHRVGVGRTGGGLEVHVDGRRPGGLGALARLLPVRVLDPGVHNLIEGGPRERRRFLDWGVFHVEHSYLEQWRQYRRALGQRNASLKAGQRSRSWDEGLVAAGNAVGAARRRYVDRLTEALAGLGETLLGRPVEIRYREGWRRGLAFAEALEASSRRDRESGVTQVGPHRADLEVSLGAEAVRETISRGQQKLVAAALILGEIRVFSADQEDGGLLLVDDPAAELDQRALEALLAVLDDLPAQQILTSLSEAHLPPGGDAAVFHVKQGSVRSVV